MTSTDSIRLFSRLQLPYCRLSTSVRTCSSTCSEKRSLTEPACLHSHLRGRMSRRRHLRSHVWRPPRPTQDDLLRRVHPPHRSYHSGHVLQGTLGRRTVHYRTYRCEKSRSTGHCDLRPDVPISRTVTGLGTGFETSTIPTWHAECAKAHSRGFAVFIEVCCPAADQASCGSLTSSCSGCYDFDWYHDRVLD